MRAVLDHIAGLRPRQRYVDNPKSEEIVVVELNALFVDTAVRQFGRQVVSRLIRTPLRRGKSTG